MFAERIGLVWNPPKDDGGSKITNYVVEKREDNRKSWVHVSNDPKECAYVVTRLTENHEYEFRVMAQNKFGVGPPLVSEPEKARNLFSKFSLIIYLFNKTFIRKHFMSSLAHFLSFICNLSSDNDPTLEVSSELVKPQ